MPSSGRLRRLPATTSRKRPPELSGRPRRNPTARRSRGPKGKIPRRSATSHARVTRAPVRCGGPDGRFWSHGLVGHCSRHGYCLDLRQLTDVSSCNLQQYVSCKRRWQLAGCPGLPQD